MSVLCIGLVGRVFAKSQGECGSIPSLVMPKTQKIDIGYFLI